MRRTPSTESGSLQRIAAAATAVLIPMPAVGIAGLSLGVVAVILMFPVMIQELKTYRGASSIGALWLLAVVTSPLVAMDSLTDMGRSWDREFGLRISVFFLAGLFGVIGVLWCRSILADRTIMMLFALGVLAQAVLTPDSWGAQPWKFAFAWPVAVLLLAVIKPRFAVLALVGLAAVSFSQDARSFGALCAFAAVMHVLFGRRRLTRVKPAVAISVVGVATFAILQMATWAALNGYLGGQIQDRTVTQTDSGQSSILTGARPESAAAFSLFADRPVGLGPGVVPSSADISVAKSGLAAAGGATTGEYVDRYMFNQRVELHSIAADWWVLFGPFGLALAVFAIGFICRSVVRRASQSLVTAPFVLVATVATWDMLFSPIASNSVHVVLALALCLERVGRKGHEQERPSQVRDLSAA